MSASLACIRSARTGVMDGCEQPYGCWESNSDPQQEMLLTSVQDVYFKLCACVFEHIQVCVSAVLLEARRGHQIPQLEFQVVVNHLTCVLGAEIRPSAKVVCTLDH